MITMNEDFKIVSLPLYFVVGDAGSDCRYSHTAFNSSSVIWPINFQGINSLSW